MIKALIFLICFAAGITTTCDDWLDSNWFYAVLTGLFGLVSALLTAYFTARFNAKFKPEDER